MNTDQIGGVVRTLLAAGGGWLAGKGILPFLTSDPLFITQAAGLLTTAIAAWWSWKTNSTPALVASVNAKPDVAGHVQVAPK